MTYHEIALSKSYSEFSKKVENDIAELVRQEGCTTGSESLNYNEVEGRT